MRKSRIRVLRHVAMSTFLLAVFTGIGPLQAQAQQRFEHQPVAWWAGLESQLISLLRSPDHAVQERALQHIIYFANHRADQVDLSRSAPIVLEIYESDTNDRRRIMALSALHALDEPFAMKRLREHVRWEQSPRLKQLTLAVLADHDARLTI